MSIENPQLGDQILVATPEEMEPGKPKVAQMMRERVTADAHAVAVLSHHEGRKPVIMVMGCTGCLKRMLRDAFLKLLEHEGAFVESQDTPAEHKH